MNHGEEICHITIRESTGEAIMCILKAYRLSAANDGFSDYIKSLVV